MFSLDKIFSTNKINFNYFLYATVAINPNMFHENEEDSSLMHNKYKNIDQTVFLHEPYAFIKKTKLDRSQFVCNVTNDQK